MEYAKKKNMKISEFSLCSKELNILLSKRNWNSFRQAADRRYLQGAYSVWKSDLAFSMCLRFRWTN